MTFDVVTILLSILMDRHGLTIIYLIFVGIVAAWGS